MGKASKWFRSLLSSKRSPEKEKSSKWSLASSGDNSGKLRSHAGDPLASPYGEGIDANKHAIAVAAATAAVAEAALAAAQAAAEVVRLTSGGGRSGRGAPDVGGDRRTVVAAVKIQAAFRAYLARRALKALKGLVKLQALVRGHIVRKQSADMLRRMQAMARIQARASAHRSYPPESPYAKTKFSNSHHPSFANPRKYEERPNPGINGGSLFKPNHPRSRTGLSATKESSQIASRWLNHWMEQCAWEKLRDDDRSDKILEIDTWNPHPNSNNKTRNDKTTPTSHYFSAWNETGPAPRLPSNLHRPNPSVSSEDDQIPARTADNSPRLHSASCRPATTGSNNNPRGPSSLFAPARSECSRSLFGEYIGHPGYMANTESSRAKVRSHSAPKQRVEELGLGGPYGGGDFWEYADTASERGSFLAGNHRAGNYRYSGQVKRQGTPTRDASVGFSSIYGRRI